MEYSQPVLVDLNQVHTFSKTVPITFPPNVVDGSQRILVTAIGEMRDFCLSLEVDVR